MSNILAIDYGRKKIGLAVGEIQSRLAEPLGVVRFEVIDEAVNKISKIPNISKIILGISEGKMALETKEFGKKLEEKLGVPVIYQDETLSTREAQAMSIEAGMRRKKRANFEDAFAAAQILQNYLDRKGTI